jgi:hypothetical protein
MAKDTTLAAISDETKEMLEEHVKKGKPRKFFLICKGATINTLEVFKKGPFGPKIMKAKKDGFKGEATYGIVTGQGKELYFQLAGNQAVAEIMKVDSFCEKPPTKRAKLREFLADNDLNFKCNYYILNDPSLAPNPDSEGGASGAPPASCKVTDDGDSSESETNENESEEITTPPVSDTNLFTDRLKALKPEIDRVVASGEPVGQEVKLRVSEAAMFARKKENEKANGLLDQVEKLLKQDIPKAPPTPPVDLSGAFNKRFGELIARVKLVAGSEWDQDLKLKASEAGMFARKKDFEQANECLDAVESLLNDIEESLQNPTETPELSALEKWKAARSEVTKALHDLAKAIIGAKDPEAKEAIILIKAIGANLTESPDTLQKVNELERYLVDDDIIEEAESENGFGIEVNIREPLMSVLEELKQELAA